MDDITQFVDGSSVVVIIVNYKTPKLTINAIRSLAGEVKAQPSTRVVVIDNDSRDGSSEAIASAISSEGWSSWARFIPSSHNGGYAYGNNLALRPALQAKKPPKYFLLLNPDTEVRPGAVHTLVDFMEARPEVGITGSALENADGSMFARAFRFPSVLSELDDGLRLGLASKVLGKWVVAREMGDSAEQVDWLPGASMMIRRQVFESVGLMDEEYFLYYEETDFCLQAKRAGWACWYVPASRVVHISGQSTGVTGKNVVPKRRPQYLFDSRRRYYTKNYGWGYAALADVAWSLGLSSWRLRRAVQRKPDNDPPHLLIDSLRNSVFVKR